MRRSPFVVVVVALMLLAGCSSDGADDEPSMPGSSNDAAPPKIAIAVQLRPVISIDPDELGPQLTCRPGDCMVDDLAWDASVVLEGIEGNRFSLGPVIADGLDVQEAKFSADQAASQGGILNISLLEEGARDLEAATARAVMAVPPRNTIAIVVDGAVVSYPTVTAVINDGQFVISGGFDAAQGRALADRLSG